MYPDLANVFPHKLDHTTLSAFHECPRKCHLKYIKGLSSTYGSTALRAGSAIHAGMEGYYSHVKEFGWSNDGKAIERMFSYAAKEYQLESDKKEFNPDYRNMENITQVLMQYIDEFRGDEGFLKVRHTERAFKLLMKPSTCQPFYFTGKIDQEISVNGMDWLNEFKTTGYSADAVIRQLVRSSQIMGYAYASKRVHGIESEGNFVTVLYFKANKSKVTGEYGKLSVQCKRVPQIYNDYDLEEWRKGFVYLAGKFQECYYDNYFPPRLHSCYTTYGKCEFLNLCEQGRPMDEVSIHGYEYKEPWDVTTQVPGEAVIEGEE